MVKLSLSSFSHFDGLVASSIQKNQWYVFLQSFGTIFNWLIEKHIGPHYHTYENKIVFVSSCWKSCLVERHSPILRANAGPPLECLYHPSPNYWENNVCQCHSILTFGTQPIEAYYITEHQHFVCSDWYLCSKKNLLSNTFRLVECCRKFLLLHDHTQI